MFRNIGGEKCMTSKEKKWTSRKEKKRKKTIIVFFCHAEKCPVI